MRNSRVNDERLVPIYGLIAEFTDDDEVLAAAHQAYAAGYRRMEAYSPFPVHGLAETLGHRPRHRLNWIVLGGFFVGALIGFGLQYYASAINYPVNIGGRPLNSWPAFVPVTFELAILVAAVAAVLGRFALSGLPQQRHPVFSHPRFDLASQDRFFLVIEAYDPRFDIVNTRRFLEGLRPVEVSEVDKY